MNRSIRLPVLPFTDLIAVEEVGNLGAQRTARETEGRSCWQDVQHFERFALLSGEDSNKNMNTNQQSYLLRSDT